MKTLLSPVVVSATLLSGLVTAEPLTVYTYESFNSEWGPGPQLEQLFEAECGCDVSFVGLEDGVALLNRLRLEGNQTQADIVLGLDDGLVAEAAALGLLAEHRADITALTLPYEWQNPYFVPYDYGHFAFVYDSTRVTNPPASMQELLDRDDLSLIYQDPRVSTPGQGLMLWLKALYGDESAQAWQKISAKTVTVSPGWSEAYALFLEGNSDMVLSYVTSPAYHLTWDETDQYQAALFSEGHYVQVEVAAALATSRQPELAQQFLSFLISRKAQDVFAGTNWMWPVLADADKPDAFNQLVTPTTLVINSNDIAPNRKGWIREWRSAVSQ